MRRRTALFTIFGAFALAGCATPRLDAGLEEPFDPTRYRLASGDRLRVIVFGQDNLSNIYAVDPAGAVTMPLIAAVEVRGLTTREAADRIAGRLRSGFIREPRVTVEVDTYRPFFILGEVNQAGQYPYVAGLTVETAVAIAGGFTPRAVRSSATISRPVGGEIKRFSVPADHPVRPGDTVMVRERWF
ncbi:MAG: polysaccharide export protein [Salinarimonadaceae bacterium]|nr:MAG: polysaccharide export protein [Salinarimonadaceae bacterium]